MKYFNIEQCMIQPKARLLGDAPTMIETREAARGMTNEKAVELDSVPIESLNVDDPIILRHFLKAPCAGCRGRNRCHSSGRTPLSNCCTSRKTAPTAAATERSPMSHMPAKGS